MPTPNETPAPKVAPAADLDAARAALDAAALALVTAARATDEALDAARAARGERRHHGQKDPADDAAFRHQSAAEGALGALARALCPPGAWISVRKRHAGRRDEMTLPTGQHATLPAGLGVFVEALATSPDVGLGGLWFAPVHPDALGELPAAAGPGEASGAAELSATAADYLEEAIAHYADKALAPLVLHTALARGGLAVRLHTAAE